MSKKQFKTLDEQLEILKTRGLLIKDEERAKKYLLSQNYYNIINGYAKFFPRDDDENYTNNTTFDEITNLYIFEREFKQALLLAILETEAHLKSIFAYRFAEKYGSKTSAYLNTQNYNADIKSVDRTISELKRIITYHGEQKEGSIAHYVNTYNNVPIWVLINYLNLGVVVHLLKESTDEIQNSVARDFLEFISQNVPGKVQFTQEILCSFLSNIIEIRNVCAHNNRIIGFRCRQNSKYWSPVHGFYEKWTKNDRRSPFSVFISLQCFISKTEYAFLHNTILKRAKKLSTHLESISINSIFALLGFPDNWHKTTQRLEQ